MASNVGELKIALSFDKKSLKSSMAGVEADAKVIGEKSGDKLSTGFAAKIGVITAIAQKAFSAVSNVVSQNINSAISRVDTLNNFSNVMSNLGVAADESQAAITRMADKLTGLPTSLDAGAAAVQRFTSKNGDVQKSTDIFLALNNALLAGGAPAEQQAAALEQISQAYAKGKPDMQEWRSIMTVMPAQLNQVAKAMGQVDANALGEGLRNGKISMDDFIKTIVELNTEGVNGLASFEEQAKKATGGIQTSMANLNTAVTKVIADAFNGDNMAKSIENLQTQIQNTMPKLVQGIAGGIGGVLAVIPDFIVGLVSGIEAGLPSIIQGIGQLISGIGKALPKLISSLINIIMEQFPVLIETLIANMPALIDGLIQCIEMVVNAAPMILSMLLPAVTQLILSVITMITRPDFLQALIRASIMLFLGIVKALPQVIIAIVNALPDIITNIIEFLTDPSTIIMLVQASVQLFMALVQAVPQILGALIGAFGQLFSNLWNVLKTRFTEFAGQFGSTISGVFKNAINGVLQFIENFINGPIDAINGFIGLINDKFGKLGINISTIGRVSLPRLAQGGVTTGATTAIIGEAGQEAVLPLERNTGNWAGLLASTLAEEMGEQGGVGGGIVVEKIEIKIDDKLDAYEIDRILEQRLRRLAI